MSTGQERVFVSGIAAGRPAYAACGVARGKKPMASDSLGASKWRRRPEVAKAPRAHGVRFDSRGRPVVAHVGAPTVTASGSDVHTVRIPYAPVGNGKASVEDAALAYLKALGECRRAEDAPRGALA